MVFRWILVTPTPRVSLQLTSFYYGAYTDTDLGDWECFAAAVASTDTRTMLIKTLATWINETPTNRPLTDLYDTASGK